VGHYVRAYRRARSRIRHIPKRARRL
jgi:hypothetical protein